MRALPAAPERLRSLSDVGSVGLAVAVVIGAVVARPVPLVLGPAIVAVACCVRRPWLLLVGSALLASALAARADAGLHPLHRAQVRAVMTLVSDPAPSDYGVRALVRWHSQRLEVRASGPAAGSISAALAGEKVALEGRVGPAPPADAWLRVHHVAGVVEATSAERAGSGTAPWRAANRVRRLLEDGAASLSPVHRSLFNGFVLGDDRDQPATVADDFRAAGLTHLLAVSGENVAFVLALLTPGLRRLRLGGRWLATIGAIGFFALITRAEPSVLRAVVMAGLAVTASSLGRQVAPIRLLAYAVAGLVLVDPFLVDSVGFRLSVGASLGIVVLAPWLRAALPGPAPIAEALAVTLAAQAGVAPVLVSTFGGVPVVSVPANLLAVPVAGLVMIWGLGAGLVAGVVGGRLAILLHGPTALMITWIAAVARHAARMPLGDIRLPEAIVLIVGLVVVALGVRLGRSRWAGPGFALVALALLLPACLLRWSAPPQQAEPVAGVVLYRSGGATVADLSGVVRTDRLLAGLRRAGVRRVDLLVLRSGGSVAAAQAAALRHRWPIGRVLQPVAGTVPGADAVAVGASVPVGPFTVTIRANRPRLLVQVESRTPLGSTGAPRARAPPLRHHVPSGRGRHFEPHAGLVLRRRPVLRLRRVPPPGRRPGA